MRSILGISVGVACLLSMAPAVASDGTIEIWEPTTITESGHYVVTRDISGSPPIIVAAENVHLDVNGFTLYNPTTSDSGIYVNEPSANVTIENGTIEGGYFGIYVSSSVVQGLTIRRMTIRESAGDGINMWAVANGIIEDNVILSPGDDGIDSAMRGSVIRGNIVQSAAGYAIVLKGVSGDGGRNNVVGNVIKGTQGAAGIWVSAQSHLNHVVDNLVTGGASFGIYLHGFSNVYRGNVALGNGGTGCTGVGTAEFCDPYADDISAGDNFMPTQM